jgi:hypothetical protein
VTRGSSPLGWVAALLIAVAYAHVLLELAGGVLAVAIGVRLLISPAGRVLRHRARQRDLLWHAACRAAVERRRSRERERDS